MADKKYVKVSEAAKILGLSPNTVRKYFDNGEFPGIRLSGGHRLIDIKVVLMKRDELPDRE